MINSLKQFAVSATKLKHNIFGRARITLTFYYILIIMLVMGLFSCLLYFALIDNIRTDLRDQFDNEIIEQEVYSQTVDHVEDTIIGGDISILIVFGFLSYFLANRTLNPIKKALSDQQNFSADASHELRTPLAIMQSEAEIILRNNKATTQDYKDVLRSGLEEISKMKKIIEDLLLMARSTQKSKQDSFTEINLSALVQKIVDTMEPTATVKHLKLKCQSEEHIYTKGNAYFLEHAISNILGNAIKYTEIGHVHVTVTARNHSVTIRIQDSGTGIHKKDIPYLFERFYTAHSTTDTDGAGLGLAIADKIIKEHSGRIEIESELGHGTEVIITLPSA